MPPDTLLSDGDRIELYRPLIADPKAARKKRATEQGYRWQGRTRRAARQAQT
jgi:putative ubiquitin-RnfH superfamily antitoxin RatB of RatAB toxin-antitoxin module